MTISSQLNRSTLLGNGVTTTQPITFPFHSASDLVALLIVISTGVQTIKTITTHYTVTGTPDALGHYSNGGAVEWVTPPSALERAVVYRDPSRIQSLDLVNNDNLPAESVEAAIDYQTMLIQRVADLIGRSLRQPDGDSAAIATLPSTVDRASKFAAFDANGDPIAAAGTSANLTPVSAFINTLLDDANAATARATLGVIKATLSGEGLAIIEEFAYSNLAGVPGRLLLPPMAIKGLIPSNSGSSELTISAGSCADATGAQNMILASAKVKFTDVAWAVGTGAGMLDVGVVGSNDYYIWLIKRADTGVVDVLSSLSATAPTMPANYTFKRLIGFFTHSGATDVAMHCYEHAGGALELAWDVPALTVDLAAGLTTTRRTDAIRGPTAFSTIAKLTVSITDAVASNGARIMCPDETDAAVSITAAPLCNIVTQVNALTQVQKMEIRTSAGGLIAARATVATLDAYRVQTDGFIWARRN